MTSQVNQLETSAAHQAVTPEVMRDTLSRPIVLALFLVCATQPYGIELGPILIGPYRLVLAVVGPFLLVQWLAGRFGRILLPDFLIMGYVVWILVSLTVNGQTNRLVEWGGAQVVDILFAYLLGRAAIQNHQDFYFFTRFLLYLLLFLLPFAFLESTMGIVILRGIAENLPLARTFGDVTLEYPPRMGLLRAQVGSAHPILYGVLCSMGFSFGLVGLSQSPGRPSIGRRLLLTSGSYMGVFFSLSSGAYLSVGLQGLLMAWNWFLHQWDRRWHALAAIIGFCYILIAIFAERPPALIIARIVAFSSSTAWNRYMIWQFGSAEVMRNPIFGMGIFSDWQRAPWMPSSIDNHWLNQAMRFGLVGIGLLLGAYFYIIYRLVKCDFSRNSEMAAIRNAFVFTLIALFIAYSTVAAWDIQWSLLMLLLGASTWIFTNPAKPHLAGTDNSSGTGSRHNTSTPKGPLYGRYTTVTPTSAKREQSNGSSSRYTRFVRHPGNDPGG